MKTLSHDILRHALVGGAAALLVAGTAQADVLTDRNKQPNVVQYQMDLDAEQSTLDRERARIDREQAALDRRRDRWRSELQDAGWRFRMLDADNNAVITEAEAQAMPVVARMFSSLDANGNNKLTATEFQNIAVHLSGAPFASQ